MQYHDISNLATKVVRDAGKKSLEFFRSDIKVDIKKDQSLVSIADKECELVMRALIKKTYPDHEFYGEEYGGSLTSKNPTWILDPIEGTTNFLHGIPVFGSQLAVLYQQEIIISAMYEPVSGTLITAQQNQGSYKNEYRIQLQPQKTNEITLLFDSGRDKNELDHFLSSSVVGNFRSIRRFGSLVTDIDFLTTSKFSCYLGFNAHVYDFAPAYLILKESSYRVFDNSLTTWSPTPTTSLFACHDTNQNQIKAMLEPIINHKE